jgi:HK97 family phage prohead protease
MDNPDEVSRAKAAEARRKAFTEGADPPTVRRARRSLPTDVHNNRTLTFPATITAKREYLVKRSCECGDECLVCACEAQGGESFWSRAAVGPASADALPGVEFVHLSGVASVTETPYDMWDFYGPYTERVARDAFSDSLSRQPDVAFLVNHEGMTMARTRAGTLLLATTTAGLSVETWLNPQRHDVSDFITAVRDGCIDQMSFGAMLEDGIWNEDFSEFTLTRLDLDCGDVSGVNFGANPKTTLAARARRVMDEIDQMPDAVARSAWRQLERRFNTVAAIREQLAPPPSAPPPEAPPAKLGRSVSLVHAALLAADD